MNRNPILEEIYEIREKLLAGAGGDIHKYIQQARERALASGRPLAESKHGENPMHRSGEFKVTALAWRERPTR